MQSDGRGDEFCSTHFEMFIEICATNLQSALHAQAAAAHRIELCANLELGGTTPSAGLIRMARQSLHIPIHVLIRPRGGDFCYTQSEIEVMRQDIRYCKSLGIDGIVIGVLNADASINREQMRHLIELARPMSICFHRAFDLLADPQRGLKELLQLGVDRLLTSGLEPTAWQGRTLIRSLVQEAGEDLVVMPGSGINEDNIMALQKETGAVEFHLSAKKRIASSFEGTHSKLSFSPCDAIPDYDRFETDPERVQNILKLG